MDKKNINVTTISIPKVTAEKLRGKMKGTGFSSLSSYVVFLLRELLSVSAEDKKKEPFSADDEAKVKERLRKLGYLD